MKMLDKDIERIESELDISLPEELTEKYKSDLFAGIEEFPELTETFIMEPELLIRLNKRFREKGLFNKPFPKNHLAIGREVNNTYYIVDLNETPLRVFRVKNTKAWRYNSENLEKNLVFGGVPSLEKVDTFIENFVLFHLKLKKDSKIKEELGIPDCELTGPEINKILEEMAEGTFEEINWPQIWGESLVVKFLTTDIDLEAMSIAYHNKEAAEWCYDETPSGSVVIAHTGVDGCHYCVVPKQGALLDESPVYYVSPMDSEGTVVWAAKDFIDFLSIGVALGSFTYISGCYSCDKEEFLHLIEESWSEDDENKKREAIKLLEENFPLRKYDDLFKYVNDSYEDINNHAVLDHESEVIEVKLGYFNKK